MAAYMAATAGLALNSLARTNVSRMPSTPMAPKAMSKMPKAVTACGRSIGRGYYAARWNGETERTRPSTRSIRSCGSTKLGPQMVARQRRDEDAAGRFGRVGHPHDRNDVDATR